MHMHEKETNGRQPEQPRSYGECAVDAIELHADTPEETRAREVAEARRIIDLVVAKIADREFVITRRDTRDVLLVRLHARLIDEKAKQLDATKWDLIQDEFNERFPDKMISHVALKDWKATKQENKKMYLLCLLGCIPGCIYLCSTDDKDYEFEIRSRRG
jgi:hypothetical protein